MKVYEFVKQSLLNISFVIVGLAVGIGMFAGYSWIVEPPAYIETNTEPHFASIDNDVVIYTTSWCDFCKRAKKYLREKNIEFYERDIELNDKNTEQLYNSIGLKGVPQIIIGDKIINGFNKELIDIELASLESLH
ncbi:MULTISPECIES: glutaredoxin family protein [Pseudoalteromonas]|uniref:glutaredoxin family protein n=1 Tax=Pseudoalteromonas TaxID=53246 RepID=UPI000691CDB0|nr:glutaredoxin domain-containing protein [Pseudoalteromonas piratica]